MKLLLIETAPISNEKNAKDAHVRNSITIRDYLISKGHDCRLVSKRGDLRDHKEDFDLILISYATLYFDFRYFEQIIEHNKHRPLGWITNEYNIAANSSFNKRLTFVITNFDEKRYRKKFYRHYISLNLNALIYQERRRQIQHKYDCVYYGTFRKNREPYFREYLHEPVMLSVNEKNFRKYKSFGVTSKALSQLSWVPHSETLRLFKTSLYIEDEFTHTCFNHLANRFYESAFCNAAPIFDSSCLNTIKQSGCEVPDLFIVSGLQDLKRRLEKIDDSEREKFLSYANEFAVREKRLVLSRLEGFLCEMSKTDVGTQ